MNKYVVQFCILINGFGALYNSTPTLRAIACACLVAQASGYLWLAKHFEKEAAK